MFPNFTLFLPDVSSSYATYAEWQRKINSFLTNYIDRYSGLNFLSNQNVKQIMSESSLIVIPSLWDEPFGLVAAEAMSCGVGIISSNSGGLPEIIKGNGILIENVNEKKIVLELEKVLSSNEKLKKLQELSWKNFKLFSSQTSKELDIIRKKLFLR